MPEPSRARHVPVVNEGPIEITCHGRCRFEVSTWKLPDRRAGFRCTTPAVLPVGVELLETHPYWRSALGQGGSGRGGATKAAGVLLQASTRPAARR